MTRENKKNDNRILRLLHSRSLVLIVIILLFCAGVFIVNRTGQDPAAKLPRQMAEQLLRGWQNCDFDMYMRAKSHAFYKDIKEKIEGGRDKQEFDETCGKIQIQDLLHEEKSKKTDSEGTIGYRFDYKLKQSMSDEWNEVVVLPLIVIGDERDGFLITVQTPLNEEDYKRSQSKTGSQAE